MTGISLEMLREEMGWEFEQEQVEAELRFTDAELLCPELEDVKSGTVYIGLLSEALSFAQRKSGAVFLCVRNRVPDDCETSERMRGVYVVRRNMELFELYNSVHRFFRRVLDWQYALRCSAAKHEGIQKLLTLSEDIIGNHITVMDATFKLIAATYNIHIDNPVTNELLELGYHSRDTMERLLRGKRFEQFEAIDDIIVSSDRAMGEYVTVKRAFHIGGTLSMVAVMVCNTRLSQGVVELFGILTQSLALYAGEIASRPGGSAVGAFMGDLINGRIDTYSEAQDRALNAGVAFKGSFNLFLLGFSGTQNVPIPRILSILSQSLVQSHVFRYENNILILNSSVDRKNFAENLRERLRIIDGALINEGEVQCGVSNTFNTLYEMPVAYKQAAMAINIGEYLPERAVDCEGLKKIRAYYFEDYAINYLIYASKMHSYNLLGNSMSSRIMNLLSGMEKKYHVEYSRILYTHLICERRATASSALLKMHRNTVLYHIRRIEEQLNISLDDPDTRLKLLLGFKTTEMETFLWDFVGKGREL